MKKILVLFIAFALSLTLIGCAKEEELSNIPDEVTMAELDDYMERPDVQYVDLRNFDDKLNAGYIAGFEMIPFFDYLEFADVLVRTDGDFVFAAEDIHAQGALRELFNEDKTIFLMCGSGTRAGYVKDALLSLGYTDVVNVGGIDAYSGDYSVLGDATFVLDHPAVGPYTPGTYIGYDGSNEVVVSINDTGAIEFVFFNSVYCTVDTDEDDVNDSDCTTKQVLGDDYNMVLFGEAVAEWYVQVGTLADAIVAEQGWDTTWTITDDHFDDFAGVSITVTSYQAAFEMALGLATP